MSSQPLSSPERSSSSKSSASANTGRPLAPAQLTATPEQGRDVFDLSPDLPVVLAFGGSQGAQSINRACVDAFGGRPLEFELVHVCGPRNHAAVLAELEARGERFERYHLVPYTDRLAQAMAAAKRSVYGTSR